MALFVWVLQSFLLIRSYRKPRLFLIEELDKDDITDKSYIIMFCRQFARRFERIRGLESIQLAAQHAADNPDAAFLFAPISRLNRTLAEDTDLNLRIFRTLDDLDLLRRTLLVIPAAINAGMTSRVESTWAQLRFELSLSGLLLPEFTKEGGVVIFSKEADELAIHRTIIAENAFVPLLQIELVDMLKTGIDHLVDCGQLQLTPPGPTKKRKRITMRHPLIGPGYILAWLALIFWICEIVYLDSTTPDELDAFKAYASTAALISFVILMRQKNIEMRRAGHLRLSGDTITHVAPKHSMATSAIKIADLSSVDIERSLGGMLLYYGSVRLQSDQKDFYPIKYVFLPNRIKRYVGNANIREIHLWKETLTFDNFMKVVQKGLRMRH